MRRFLIPLVVMMIVGTGFIGYQIGRKDANELQRKYVKEQHYNSKLHQQLTTEKVALFFIKSTETNMFLHPETRIINAKPDIYQAVVKALFQDSLENSGLVPIFPEGTKVLGVKVDKGLATVDLNKRATELNVGSEGELLAIASIVNSLTKLPDIFEVKILIEGQEVESLAGHVDLTQTFKYNEQVVK